MARSVCDSHIAGAVGLDDGRNHHPARGMPHSRSGACAPNLLTRTHMTQIINPATLIIIAELKNIFVSTEV